VTSRRPARPSTQASAALSDLVKGVLDWRLWLGLAVHDIRIRYQRTLLGTWWITASMAATVMCLGLLFSAVLKTDIHVYLPYLAVGMVTWHLINAVVLEAPQAFIDSQHIITSLRMPLAVHAMRCVMRNTLIFAHNLVAAVAACLIFGVAPTAAIWLLPATLAILLVGLSGLAIVLAVIGTRFRDVGPILGILLQLTFFMTPILWRPTDLPHAGKWWVSINPVYHLIEVVRGPLLGAAPAALSLAIAAATALLLVTAAALLYRRTQHHIPYWL